MRLLTLIAALCCAPDLWAAQPFGIRLDPNGVSFIYPVVDSQGWSLTQPAHSAIYAYPDSGRVTHWADEYFAQDWARGCGQTYGLRLYAGISGEVAWAGPRGPYGVTVAIYDRESGFVLKYSHLSEAAVSVGDYVLAGKSLVGRVGNTGNVQSAGCRQQSGSHLHLALFKNVSNPNARPVSVTVATAGTGPTQFAAPFGYATSVALAKTSSSPTVFAVYYGTRVPVAYGSFVSHGWDFDKSKLVFNPLANQALPPHQLALLPEAYYFWPFRDHSLVKLALVETVYLFEDGRKHALPYGEFVCRGLRFGEIVEIPVADREQYPPLQDTVPSGCRPAVVQSMADWKKFASAQGFSRPNWSSYFYFQDWDPNWELRTLDFLDSSGRAVKIHLTRSMHQPSERYVGFNHPATGSWQGWYRIE